VLGVVAGDGSLLLAGVVPVEAQPASRKEPRSSVDRSVLGYFMFPPSFRDTRVFLLSFEVLVIDLKVCHEVLA
jgi:hypothetical protein